MSEVITSSFCLCGVEAKSMQCNSGFFYIICHNCGMEGGEGETKESARIKWNELIIKELKEQQEYIENLQAEKNTAIEQKLKYEKIASELEKIRKCDENEIKELTHKLGVNIEDVHTLTDEFCKADKKARKRKKKIKKLKDKNHKLEKRINKLEKKPSEWHLTEAETKQVFESMKSFFEGGEK